MKTWVAIALLVAVAAAVRLPRLSSPREVVFDEVHFGKFITAYCCTGQRFFDIHPPHAKLLIAGAAKLLGYLPFDFNHIGQPYGAISPIPLRLLPALTGAVLPLVFFAWLRQLAVSREIALLGGLALALDNALVVQSRLIALDGLLLVATFGAITAYLRKHYVLAGVLAGLAAGTKFTGLAALVMLGALTALQFVRAFFPRILHSRSVTGGYSPGVGIGSKPAPTPGESRMRGTLTGEVARRSLVIVASAAVVYLAGWWLHFALLPNSGPGDVWGVPTGNFWQDTVKLHKTMLSANYHLTATHPDESPAWSWPLMTTAIFYWSAPAGNVIYFLGNPVVWWGSTVLFLAALVGFARKKIRNPKSEIRNFLIPLVGILIAYAPLLRVPRALFLYHYLTPLLFVLAFGLVWLDSRAQSVKRKAQIMGIGAVLVIVFFVLFSPLTYGLDVPDGWRQALDWLPGWR